MNVGDLLIQIGFALAVASCVGFAGALLGRRGGRAAGWMFALHAAAVVAAFALLSVYFLTRRFEFEYVARHSSLDLSTAITFASTWAGQEGSILLWGALGALVGLALLRQPGPLARPAMFFVSLAQAWLLGLPLIRSPFVRTAFMPADGMGLNPLLEDPWMVVHPPVLFIGYAGLVVPFAIAAAALVRNEFRDWNRMVWPWALFGVVTLGAGIALGGIWAYKTLGWGGYWGWDPVENASLVPWLVAVGLVHGLLIERTTGSLRRTNLALAMLSWATVIGGTYLTRSGILQDFSVHSFAGQGLNAPLVAFLGLFTVGGALLLLGRWKTIGSGRASWSGLSRESALWFGLMTVLILAGLVTLGTTAPLLTSIFGQPATVDIKFYEHVSVPVGILLVLLMALAPALRWTRQHGMSWLKTLVPGALGMVLFPVVLFLAGVKGGGALLLAAVSGLALGVNASVSWRLFRRGWSYGSGYLVHVGIAVMVLGMVASSLLGKSERVKLLPGETAEALGYRMTFRGVEVGPRGERTLRVHVTRGRTAFEARPVLVPARDKGMVRKPAIGLGQDLYLSPVELADATADPVWIAKGGELAAGDAQVSFTGFRMESHEDLVVYAELRVRRNGEVLHASPGMRAGGAGAGSPVPAEVPGYGSIQVAKIDADGGRVALLLPGDAPGALAIVDASTKPFINLVWIGALVALLGAALAGLRRAIERVPGRGRDPARERNVHPTGRDRRPIVRRSTMSGKSSNPSATSAARSARITGGAVVLSLALGMAGGAARAAEPSGAPTSAFSDTSRPVMFLKETVVTGARYPRAYYESPQALSFVNRTQLREQAPTVAGDVLSTMPGVDNSKDSPWEQRPILRGLGGQRVLVLVDGMPMNSARGNGPHPSLVDPGQIERIEVVRGPSSVGYGSDALGGVINIITREALFTDPAQRFRGSATVGGSTADGQGNAQLEMMPRLGRLSAFLSSGIRSAGNFRSPAGEVPNSDYRDYNALSNLRWDFTEKTALKLGWQLYRGRDIGIPGLSFAFPGASQDFDFSFYNRDYVHLTLDHGYRNSWLAGTRLKAFWQQERRNFYSRQDLDWFMFRSFGLPSAGPPMSPTDTASATTLQDRYLDVDSYGFQTQLTSIRTDLYRFTAGVDMARDVTDGDNVRFRTLYDASGNPVPGPGGSPATAVRVTASVPDGRFDNYGTYAQSEWYLGPRWTAHAGARYTHYRYRTDFGLSAPASGAPGSQPSYFQPLKVDEGAASGSIGLVFTPLRDLHLSANLANGYRQPNAQELFFNGPASVGFVIGNPDLTPEKSVSYDLGMRWGPGNFAASGNLFYSTYQDLIDALRVPAPGLPTFRYTNVSEARIWGWEAELEWRFRQGWSARGQVSDAVGDITSADAILALYGVSQERAPLPNVPPIRGSFALRWSEGQGRFWVEPAARFSWRTSRMPLELPGVPQFTEFKKEWIVADLAMGAKMPWGQKLVAGVRNLADTEYRQAVASLDDPGISFYGQLTTDF